MRSALAVRQVSVAPPEVAAGALRLQAYSMEPDPTIERGSVWPPAASSGPDHARDAAGDIMPPGCVRIQVRVRNLRQIFNEMDPSPFHERDLAPEAEEFIVDWARELPRDAPVGLVVLVDEPPASSDQVDQLRAAVSQYFSRRALGTRRRLREMFSRGRTSLAIGLAVLAVTSVLANTMKGLIPGDAGSLLGESLIIGGWVAMWRPLEVFLYDWWPVRAQARLFERLSAMPVRLERGG